MRGWLRALTGRGVGQRRARGARLEWQGGGGVRGGVAGGCRGRGPPGASAGWQGAHARSDDRSDGRRGGKRGRVSRVRRAAWGHFAAVGCRG